MLYSCKCLQALIKGKGEEGAQDLLVKRSGIHALKTCAMDEMVEIRRSSLEIIAFMSRTREDVLQIVLKIGLLDLSLTYIKQYPTESIDSEVLISCLHLVSFLV